MPDRRTILKTLAAAGIGTPVFHRAAASLIQEKQELSRETLQQASWIADFDLADEDADKILASVKRNVRAMKILRKSRLDASEAPAFIFQTLSKKPAGIEPRRDAKPRVNDETNLPDSDEAIAFLPVAQLASLIRAKKLTSASLTKIYLERLKRFGAMLRCVVNLTEDLANAQAEAADKEISNGNYRGPLHGIPWGAKDLMDVPGYPTTWGIPHYKERMSEEAATIYQRLTDAGAVLVAKLSLGALAMGDKWFGGLTRNPWNPKTGSSGSSAGSASATVAGLVGFSIGTETLGSIVSPSKVCGANGFRPTFGRVSRHGCMPLSWTMDKAGPICRSVEDCALVFDAIHGADGKDRATRSTAFQWPPAVDMNSIKVGYPKGLDVEDRVELKTLQELGCEMVPVEIPTPFPLRPLASIIDVEGASVFDSLLRDGHTDGWNTWPNSFRSIQYMSAVDYLRMMRLRTRIMESFEQFIGQVDVLCNMFDIFHTNLTGHPSVVVPQSYKDLDGGGKKPTTVTFTGHLDEDAKLLAVADSFQRQIKINDRPELEAWLKRFEDGSLDKSNNPDDEEDESAKDD